MLKLFIFLVCATNTLSTSVAFGQDDIKFTSLTDCKPQDCNGLFKRQSLLPIEELETSSPLFFSDDEIDNLLHDSLFIASAFLANKTLEEDKFLHYLAGATAGRLAGELCEYWKISDKTHLNPKKIQFLCSAGAAALIGALKEAFDYKYGGHVETKDFIATATGGLFISVRYVF